MSVVNKDIPQKHNLLGQYITPSSVAEFCLSKIDISADLVIEPSCGTGVFLDKIRSKTSAQILGIELDVDLAKNYNGIEKVICPLNFYQFNEKLPPRVHFIGNPPYRSPAFSLSDESNPEVINIVKDLRKKYNVEGIREEAALFILKTVDLMKQSGSKGSISYILPSAIFKNNSKVFTSFCNFIKSNLKLTSVWNLGDEFQGVMRNLIYVTLETIDEHRYFVYDGNKAEVDSFFGVSEKGWSFRDIFHKTYLGSVPCESIFLSVKDEPKEHLRERLYNLFTTAVDEQNLVPLLSYKGRPHLLALKKHNKNKISSVLDYVREVPTLGGYDLDLFLDIDNYKPIVHRDEERYYFRHDFLKRASFVYQINPNPCRSFFFPGNPSNSSKDYFGYCDYDINRNSGPGANRTVPISNVEKNVKKPFMEYWNISTKGLPIKHVFDYMLHISKSDWYKNMKKQNQRFYFCVPLKFDESFLKTIENH
jgi:hypothetical protein